MIRKPLHVFVETKSSEFLLLNSSHSVVIVYIAVEKVFQAIQLNKLNETIKITPLQITLFEPLQFTTIIWLIFWKRVHQNLYHPNTYYETHTAIPANARQLFGIFSL